MDKSCPVRRCSTNEKITHCGECPNYPCDKFNQRKALSESEIKEKLNSEYDSSQYDEYLGATIITLELMNIKEIERINVANF